MFPKANSMTVSRLAHEQRIPCFMLAFFELDCVRRSLDSLQPLHDRLALHVVENFSEHSETHLAPYLQSAIEQGRIESWVRYAANISSNAILDALERQHGNWRSAEWIVLTDGDLECDPGWLDESLQILIRHPEVFACGVDLRTDNLPLQVFPEAAGWVPPPTAIHADYAEGRTGAHLLTLRTRDLAAFLKYRQQHGIPLVDSTMHQYCFNQRRQRWARTVVHHALHITWSLYADVHHPYTQLKTRLMAGGTCWNHQRLAPAQVVTKSGVTAWPANSSLFTPEKTPWWRFWT